MHRAAAASEITVETHLHVREDALQLYGFAAADERELFELLLGVSGVGPKVALAIVSGSTPAELRRAIVLDDIARFEAIPGVGRKTAQRVVLELKEKLGGVDVAGAAAAAATSLRARRARRARLVAARRRARARRGRSDLPVEEQVRARAQAGGVSEQFLAPVPRRRARRSSSARCGRATLDDFVGQERVKEQLAIALEAAKARGEALDHVLLAGPPGPRQDVARADRPRASSASASARSPAPRSSGRATSPRS